MRGARWSRIENGATLLGDEGVGTLEAEAESLVEPGADGVADIDWVEQEERFEVGGDHLGLESLEPVLAEALNVDPLLEVDYLGANKVFFVCL